MHPRIQVICLVGWIAVSVLAAGSASSVIQRGLITEGKALQSMRCAMDSVVAWFYRYHSLALY